jgi:hypothetical protein
MQDCNAVPETPARNYVVIMLNQNAPVVENPGCVIARDSERSRTADAGAAV